ncbi:MAG: hypothetical protein ACRD2Z_06210 [Thermoanaerobaculia bacterium]
MAESKLTRALFILRVSLALFLLLWGLDKIVVSEATVGIFDYFYKVSIGTTAAQALGGLEILLALAILAGVWKTWTYGLGLLLHAISTLSTWRQLLSPFGENHLFIAALPVLGAFVALFLLRNEDTRWTLSRAGS